jgi:hypothetical protein
MTTTDLPESIPFVRVEVALARFGIPLDDLREITIGRQGIEVTQFRRDADGRLRLIGEDVATVTTRIPLDREVRR